jgi:hypothetical protein
VSLPNGGSAGYAPIFLVERTRHVNLGLLVVQWVGVANVVALLYALLRDDAARGGGPRCVRAILPRSPEAGRWR